MNRQVVIKLNPPHSVIIALSNIKSSFYDITAVNNQPIGAAISKIELSNFNNEELIFYTFFDDADDEWCKGKIIVLAWMGPSFIV